MYERLLTLRVKALLAMTNSSTAKTRKLMNLFISSERQYRNIREFPKAESRFLNWETNENGKFPPTARKSRCSTLAIRAKEAGDKLNLTLTFTDDNLIQGLDLKKHGQQPIVYQKKLTKMIIERVRYENRKQLTKKEYHCHSLRDLKRNADSNFFFGNSTAEVPDKLVKFVVKGRLNQLPTGENKEKWASPAEAAQQNFQCPHCHSSNAKDSLMHRLNGCPARQTEKTRRHNAVVRRIRTKIAEKLHVNPLENSTVRINGARLNDQHLQLLKPDLQFVINNKLHLVEITTPYGERTQRNQRQGGRVSSLALARQQKVEKYTPLVNACAAQFGIQVELFTVVISSLGAIPPETRKDLQILLGLRKFEEAKFLRSLCIDACRGSYLMFYDIKARTREELEVGDNENIAGDPRHEEHQTSAGSEPSTPSPSTSSSSSAPPETASSDTSSGIPSSSATTGTASTTATAADSIASSPLNSPAQLQEIPPQRQETRRRPHRSKNGWNRSQFRPYTPAAENAPETQRAEPQRKNEEEEMEQEREQRNEEEEGVEPSTEEDSGKIVGIATKEKESEKTQENTSDDQWDIMNI
jgi:hypothetical protein